MADRQFTAGDIVLADIGHGVMRSVRIRDSRPAGADAAHATLEGQLLDGGQVVSLSAGAIDGRCDKPFGCIDAADRCTHCQEHRGDGHQPGCPHDTDECDAHPDDDADFATFEVHVQIRAMDGLVIGAQVLEVLARNGFTLDQPAAAVWRHTRCAELEFVGTARLGAQGSEDPAAPVKP
jgi:hypothetical protein